jgi:hypothetical protein
MWRRDVPPDGFAHGEPGTMRRAHPHVIASPRRRGGAPPARLAVRAYLYLLLFRQDDAVKPARAVNGAAGWRPDSPTRQSFAQVHPRFAAQ